MKKRHKDFNSLEGGWMPSDGWTSNHGQIEFRDWTIGLPKSKVVFQPSALRCELLVSGRVIFRFFRSLRIHFQIIKNIKAFNKKKHLEHSNLYFTRKIPGIHPTRPPAKKYGSVGSRFAPSKVLFEA